jgi:hypothetical protein
MSQSNHKHEEKELKDPPRFKVQFEYEKEFKASYGEEVVRAVIQEIGNLIKDKG